MRWRRFPPVFQAVTGKGFSRPIKRIGIGWLRWRLVTE
ncbi:MAG: hypothetical protein ACI87O_003097, partial [Planctomycetota bacterium]